MVNRPVRVVCHYENDIYTGEISAYWPEGTFKQTGQFNTYAGKWSDGKKTGPWAVVHNATTMSNPPNGRFVPSAGQS